MKQYILLHTGKIVIAYSDNVEEQTIDVYDSNIIFNPCVHSTVSINYSDIKMRSNNISDLQNNT